MKRHVALGVGIAVAVTGAISSTPAGAGEAAREPSRTPPLPSAVSVAFTVGEPAVIAADGANRVSVPVLVDGSRTTVVTEPVDAADAATIADAVPRGALVDYLVDRTGHDTDVVVADDPAQTFHVSLMKGSRPVFDSKEYGAELAPREGSPGAMVAAGWVYGKADGSITIGDGRVLTADITGRALPQPSKRYEETYTVGQDVEVYAVNVSDWSASRPSSYDAIPVTADYAHTTTQRQAAFVVFDRDHRTSGSAQVEQIYYFTPKDVSDGKPVWDVPTQSDLLSDKGIDPASGRPYVDIVATGVTNAAYTRSTEPFEIVPDTFYYVGDNEVSLYLFDTDMGTLSPRDDKLVLIDTGWPNSGYQYWKNIEAMGHDPRDIDVVVMPHGHGDHYGTTVELVRMIENSGGSVELLSPKEDVVGLAQDAVGNTWNLPPALPASETLIRERTGFTTYDRWMDFGNVRLLPLWSPGHTPARRPSSSTSRTLRAASGSRSATWVGTAGARRSSAPPTVGSASASPTTWPGSSSEWMPTTPLRSTPTSSRSSTSTRRSRPTTTTPPTASVSSPCWTR